MPDVITGILIRSGENNNKEIQRQSGEDHMATKLGVRVMERQAQECQKVLATTQRWKRQVDVAPLCCQFSLLDTVDFRYIHLLNYKGIVRVLF